jgi:hypothetical protein
MEPGIRAEFAGKKNVFMTHPQDRSVGCVLSKTVDLPAGKRTVLQTVVAHDPRGDWTLIIKANGRQLSKKPIRPETATDGWVEVEVDLSELAGQSVNMELINQADGWSFEAGYWSEIALESR